jgi:capsular polysaccharide biosynthesis protein
MHKYHMQIRIKSHPLGTTIVTITVEASNPNQARDMARSMYNAIEITSGPNQVN